MLLCNVSRDYRHSSLHYWCQAFVQIYLPCGSWEEMGHFEGRCLQTSLVPICVVMWEWHRSSVRWGFRRGGTVRFLHVEGIGRQAELSDPFMSAPSVHLALQKSNKRPVAPFEREDLLLQLFSWKITFFSLLSSSLPMKAESVPCFAKLPVFICFSGKINTVLFPA